MIAQARNKIVVGVSSCLLGQPVRYDGGHKYHAHINRHLANHFEFRPFCPEVAIGLGTPRAPVRLVMTATGVQVLGIQNPSCNITQELNRYGNTVASGFDDVYGYIFKSRSPSCGLQDVKICDETGKPLEPEGMGVFAAAIRSACPELPVVEECHLNTATRREEFIARVEDYRARRCR